MFEESPVLPNVQANQTTLELMYDEVWTILKEKGVAL